MKIIVLHQAVSDSAPVEEQDVLVQRDTVLQSLRRLKHDAEPLAMSLNLELAREQLLARKPDLVFNLVESLGGSDRFQVMATMLLDVLGIAYTGARTNAIRLTNDKLATKSKMDRFEFYVPAVLAFNNGHPRKLRGRFYPGAWIIKPIYEHASFGMDDASVVRVRKKSELETELLRRETISGCPHFAEAFIDGREFNLSMLDGQVLAPAEIDFVDFPPDKPKIVGHAAKWDEASFEYQQTPRKFEFSDEDQDLLEELILVAENCWERFKLTGYARIDFRVYEKEDDAPYVLEINANPCLSPDAGFAAALAASKIEFDEAIQRIVAAAQGC